MTIPPVLGSMEDSELTRLNHPFRCHDYLAVQTTAESSSQAQVFLKENNCEMEMEKWGPSALQLFWCISNDLLKNATVVIRMASLFIFFLNLVILGSTTSLVYSEAFRWIPEWGWAKPLQPANPLLRSLQYHQLSLFDGGLLLGSACKKDVLWGSEKTLNSIAVPSRNLQLDTAGGFWTRATHPWRVGQARRNLPLFVPKIMVGRVEPGLCSC